MERDLLDEHAGRGVRHRVCGMGVRDGACGRGVLEGAAGRRMRKGVRDSALGVPVGACDANACVAKHVGRVVTGR
nr:hypothetical protein GCM10010200_036980 [Actinomadura rugatobispora]